MKTPMFRPGREHLRTYRSSKSFLGRRSETRLSHESRQSNRRRDPRKMGLGKEI